MKYKKILALLLAGSLCFWFCACNAHKEVKEQIAALGEITLDSKAELDAIAVAYSELSESQKRKVENYSDYEEALKKYDALVYENIETIYYELACTNYGSHSKILVGLNKYEKYFSEEQKNGLLAIYYFYEDAPEYAQDYIISRLKSPRSFYLYSLEADCFVVSTDGKYSGTVDITYGANNSYGAEVTKKVHFLLSFKLNKVL